MDRIYGMVWKKTEDKGMRLVCMFTASSKEWTRHYCRCKGCGRYISVTRRNEVCEDEEAGEERLVVD